MQKPNTSEDSEFFKKNIEPVLSFFEIKPSGNLFKDILGIAQMADFDNIEELLIKKIFHFYCIDDGTKMKAKDLKVFFFSLFFIFFFFSVC